VTTKICVNTIGGFRNSMTFLLTGLDIEAKADLVRRQLAPALGGVEHVEWVLSRTDHDDPDTNDRAVARLTVSVKDSDASRIGRTFSSAAVEIALGSYPGCTLTAPPGEASPYGVYSAAYLDNDLVEHRVVLADGTVLEIAPTPGATFVAQSQDFYYAGMGIDEPPYWKVPLGTVVGARSGDKGGDANIGVWARSGWAYAWLWQWLTTDRLRELLPETADLEIDRHQLDNLRALNFVVHGLLGEGVAASTRQDPQAKGLGEWLRSRLVDIPTSLLEDS
jgi:hypothetical protein